MKYLYGMGFEPMRLSPADLKSAPLTTRATVQIFHNNNFNNSLSLFIKNY